MRLIATLLLFLATLVPVHANTSKQENEEKLSPTEQEEVRQFVNQFAATINKTRDLTPYLNRPPASNLLDQALNDPKDPVGMVDYNLGLKIGKYRLRQFNVALWNLAYLSDLYINSRFLLQKTAIRDLTPEEQYPPNVVTLMKSNSLVNKRWRTKDLSDSDTVVRTMREFRSILYTFQRAITLMRHYFRNRPPEHTAIYKQNLQHLGPFLKEIEVDRCSSEEDCAGLPLHTQEIRVNLPVLRLVLVRLNGKLQILTIAVYD